MNEELLSKLQGILDDIEGKMDKIKQSLTLLQDTEDEDLFSQTQVLEQKLTTLSEDRELYITVIQRLSGKYNYIFQPELEEEKIDYILVKQCLDNYNDQIKTLGMPYTIKSFNVSDNFIFYPKYNDIKYNHMVKIQFSEHHWNMFKDYVQRATKLQLQWSNDLNIGWLVKD
jgi:hypothetical protein